MSAKGGNRASAWAIWWWDNGRVRVLGDAQAIAMANVAAGPRLAKLPFRVARNQDFWTVRIGPDQTGQMHNYMVTIWNTRAHPATFQTVEVRLDRPK